MVFSSKHAQGSTEYIVMLAVALIVVLVTAALLGFFPSFSGDAQQSEYDTYWVQASPISIASAQENTAGTMVTLVLENKLPKEITITNFALTPSSGTATTNSTPLTLPAGGRAPYTVTHATTLTSCTSRTGKSNLYNVTVTYSDGDYTGKIQKGVKPVAPICQ